LANELHKYAEVLVNAGQLDKALEAVDKAVGIVKLNYGDKSSTLQELLELQLNIQKFK
jgi:hypothetical protein